jgi:hydroxymethylbilane synthase
LRIGTRRSPLARVQTDRVRRALERAHPELECKIVTIETSGDRVRDRPLREVGGKGLFVKELDEALHAGAIDCAIHSLKDIPSELAPGIALVAIPERVEAHDLWIARDRCTLASAHPGTRVGTTSLRRAGQARALNAELEFGMLRGNVETRLSRVREGMFAATLLAAAGIARLEIDLGGLCVEALDPWQFVPAPGQGALGVTAREDDATSISTLAPLRAKTATVECTVERAIAERLGGSCDLPLGAFARASGEYVSAVGIVVSADGKRLLRREREGHATDARAIGHAIGDALLGDGAGELFTAREER